MEQQFILSQGVSDREPREEKSWPEEGSKCHCKAEREWSSRQRVSKGTGHAQRAEEMQAGL